MDVLDLTLEQAAEAERLFQILQPTVEAELRQLTRLLASQPDQHLLGKTEFEVRDCVHTIGAKALEAALNERKRGVPRLQPELPELPRPEQVPRSPGQDLPEPDGRRGRGRGSRLLSLPGLSCGPCPRRRRAGAVRPQADPGGRRMGDPGRHRRQLRRGGREAPAPHGRAAALGVDRGAHHRGRRPTARHAVGRGAHPRRGADWRWNRDAGGRTVAYVSVDATGVGIQGAGGAKSDGRMAWVGKVFNPRPEPTEASPKPHPPSARYLAGLMGLDELDERMRRQAAQVGMGRAERWVALTDGGNGLDDLMEVFFPRAVRILDFYHAAEHLGDLAKAYCGGEATAADERAEQWAHQMKQEGGGAILATLEALDLSGRSAAALEAHRQVTGYARNNLDRMDYPRYRQEGWPIGSGPIEAACKTVVNQRLKQSGMRWGGDGADALCHLRALYEGETGQWDAFWERSIN